ncbi:nucleoid-associated protein [Flavobacterium sp. 270]|uniref:nucleoid-associated protein n=1 Tax=Flavobacterium sp. 270 TaxID=2512114 RepID=UPI0010667FCE|nr:nucleoid-associated protein [Flavobacterium sp. 270]TDW52730.1 nucleoid-associated protein [Flavobacterium sp. 270]
MILNKIIIHELKKESESKKVDLILSEELIPISDESTALVTALSDSFRSDRILYAIFDDSEGKYFPEKFTDYRTSTRTMHDFISFTRQVIGNLVELIKPVFFATGGYFVFTEYTDNGYNFFGVFLIRDVEGKILKKTTNSYSIQTIEYVDTKNLAMACRINENRIENKEINYLSFTQLRQKEVSEYFKSWISIQQLESSIDYTKSLYKIITQIEPPINPNTNTAFDIEEFRNLVYSFASSSSNDTINVRELSKHFYQNENTITNYAEQENISIDTEFRFNKIQLKKFIKLEVNRDGINLKFSRGVLNEKVRLSNDNPNLVIIESENFAKALRNEITNT